MIQLNQENCLLLIIDVQEKLLNCIFNKSEVAKKSVILANAAKILDIPTIVTEQYPKGLGATVDSVKEVLGDTTKFFEKTDFSAVNNKEILDCIKNTEKKQVLIFGIETHICVAQTAAALAGLGYEVNVVKDACGSRAEIEYNAGLERMRDNNVHVITTEIALFELLKGAKHKNFKEIQALIK